MTAPIDPPPDLTHPRDTVTGRADRVERVLYRVDDVTELLSLSRTVVFDLLRTGRLRSVKQGRTRLIPATALRDYLALLEQEVA